MTMLMERPGATAPQRLSTSSEFVAEAGTATVAMGERLGLYELLARGSLTATELAVASQLPTWFAEGWLAAQATAGYVSADSEGRYSLCCRLPDCGQS